MQQSYSLGWTKNSTTEVSKLMLISTHTHSVIPTLCAYTFDFPRGMAQYHRRYSHKHQKLGGMRPYATYNSPICDWDCSLSETLNHLWKVGWRTVGRNDIFFFGSLSFEFRYNYGKHLPTMARLVLTTWIVKNRQTTRSTCRLGEPWPSLPM